jgi:hypothetical protein
MDPCVYDFFFFFLALELNPEVVTTPGTLCLVKTQQYIYFTDQLHVLTKHGHRLAGHKYEKTNIYAVVMGLRYLCNFFSKCISLKSSIFLIKHHTIKSYGEVGT